MRPANLHGHNSAWSDCDEFRCVDRLDRSESERTAIIAGFRANSSPQSLAGLGRAGGADRWIGCHICDEMGFICI